MTQFDETTIDSQRIYDGKTLGVRVDRVRLPGGATTQREILEHSPAVVIVPIDHEGRILLVRQYRKAAERPLLEAPAGGLEPGESPEEGVLRELREEVGFTADKLQQMTGFWMVPGFCTEYMYAYLATDLSESPLSPDEDELIQVVPTHMLEIPDMIRSGYIEDGKSIAAILMAMHIYQESL